MAESKDQDAESVIRKALTTSSSRWYPAHSDQYKWHARQKGAWMKEILDQCIGTGPILSDFMQFYLVDEQHTPSRLLVVTIQSYFATRGHHFTGKYIDCRGSKCRQNNKRIWCSACHSDLDECFWFMASLEPSYACADMAALLSQCGSKQVTFAVHNDLPSRKEQLEKKEKEAQEKQREEEKRAKEQARVKELQQLQTTIDQSRARVAQLQQTLVAEEQRLFDLQAQLLLLQQGSVAQ